MRVVFMGYQNWGHKRSVADSRIDWKLPAASIANLVRAQFDPYPNAFAYYGGQRIRVLDAKPSRGRLGGTQGRIFRREGEGVAVVCIAGATRSSFPRQARCLTRIRGARGHG